MRITMLLTLLLLAATLTAQEKHNPDGPYPSLHLYYGWPSRTADLNGVDYSFADGPTYSLTIKFPLTNAATIAGVVDHDAFQQSLKYKTADMTTMNYSQTTFGLRFSLYFGNQ